MSYHHGPRISTNGLVMLYDAGNIKSYVGSGTSLKNLSTDTNVTIPGGTAFSSSYGASSLYFTGTNSYITSDVLENVACPTTGSDFTMGIAINTPSYRYSSYLGHAQHVEHGLMIGMQSNVHRFVINNAGSNSWIDGPAPNAGVPEIIFVTHTARTMKLYYNGSLYSSGTATIDWLPKPSSYILVGYANQGGWDPYIGHIYCAMFYNRALTDGEVLLNHSAIKTRFRL